MYDTKLHNRDQMPRTENTTDFIYTRMVIITGICLLGNFMSFLNSVHLNLAEYCHFFSLNVDLQQKNGIAIWC